MLCLCAACSEAGTQGLGGFAESDAGEDLDIGTSAPTPDSGSPDSGLSLDLGDPDVGARDVGAPPARCEVGEEPAPRVLQIPVECPPDPELDHTQLMFTPSRWYLAERLARQEADAMLAPRDDYLRKRLDLCRIFEAFPELHRFEAEGANKDLRADVVLEVSDADTRRRMFAGDYAPWRCLHARIDAEVEAFPRPEVQAIQVSWKGRYDPARMAERYAAMPGISRVILPFDLGGSIRLTCAFEREGRRRYLFTETEARFPGPGRVERILVELTPEAVELVAEWEGEDPSQVPPALDPEEC